MGVSGQRKADRLADGARYLIPLAAVWSLPLLALFFVDAGELERTALFTAASDDDEVIVGSRSDDGLQPVTFDLTWAGSRSVVWPHAEGVVTQVWTGASAPLADGDPIVAVNGVTVVAQVAGMPLYRDVAIGMSGADVEWVDELLVKSGAALATTLDSARTATADTGTAIRAYQLAAGIREPSDVFERRLAVYVGQNEGVTVVAPLGTLLSQGSELLVTQPSVASVAVTLLGPSERHRLVRSVPVLVSIDGTDLALDSLVMDSSANAAITAHIPAGTPSLEAVPVRRADPVRVGVVPATAVVISDTTGARCIISVSGDGRSVERLDEEEVVPAEPGVAYVDDDFVGRRIVATPTASDAAQCS